MNIYRKHVKVFLNYTKYNSIIYYYQNAFNNACYEVKCIMALYEDARTKVMCGSGFSESFSVGVGVHQGSVLSPLLFATVIDVLSETVKKDALWESFVCRRPGANG